MNDKVKPGTRIRVSDNVDLIIEVRGKEFTTIERPPSMQSGWDYDSVWVTSDGKEWNVRYVDYVVIGDAPCVKVGTLIRVQDCHGYCEGVSGKEFTTIACPPHMIGQGHEHDQWILYDSREYFIPDGRYDIIGKSTETNGKEQSSGVCGDCNGTGEIALFTSTVKCRCMNR